jgi:DNA-binding NarL/FixJ family response regulator
MMGINPKAVKQEELPEWVENFSQNFLKLIAEYFKGNISLDFLNFHFNSQSKLLTKVKFEGFIYSVIRQEDKEQELKKLSKQQRKIVRLVAEGLSNQNIADRLGIKVGTVNAHLVQIFSRLDVHDRSDLYSYALSDD